MKTEYRIKSLEDLHIVAAQFVDDYMDKYKIFAFYAPMGSGKTTFIKAMSEYLGVEDVINSPTFSIINEYISTKTDETIYHFDLYRLSTLSDAMNIGIEDYLNSSAISFIEWPEIIEPLFTDNVLKISISVENDGERVIKIV